MLIEEKGLKETLVGTSVSKVTPLTLNFPLDNSKNFSNSFPIGTLKMELTGSFGGAMDKGLQRKAEEKKNRDFGYKTKKNTNP